jgi:hypothetical protein
VGCGVVLTIPFDSTVFCYATVSLWDYTIALSE